MARKRLFNLVNNDELKRRMQESEEARTTLSFYQYHQIENPERFRDELYREWSAIGVYGRIYIAGEGVNGQISVPSDQFEAFKEAMYNIPFLNGIRLNIAGEQCLPRCGHHHAAEKQQLCSQSDQWRRVPIGCFVQ